MANIAARFALTDAFCDGKLDHFAQYRALCDGELYLNALRDGTR